MRRCARYAGTRLGRQELDGHLVEEVEDALWSHAAIEAGRVRELPPLDRIVVAVDPPVTGHAGSDDCGIVVAGAQLQGPPGDWRAFVLEDATLSAASPGDWAAAAVEAYRRWQADRIVAEVNQGGDLVESVLRTADVSVPYRGVRASKGKVARAEPVAALYEQGRVRHMCGLDALEDQMMRLTRHGYEGAGSPDRVDALVWAVTELMIAPARGPGAPRIRTLF